NLSALTNHHSDTFLGNYMVAIHWEAQLQWAMRRSGSGCTTLCFMSHGDVNGEIQSRVRLNSCTHLCSSILFNKRFGQQEEGPEEADATEKAMEAVDNVVKSLDEEVESKEMQKQQPHDYSSMSLRNLKATHKKYLIAAK
ncbi:hypothetical protein ACJX0J_039534, partial [Zea mays]